MLPVILPCILCVNLTRKTSKLVYSVLRNVSLADLHRVCRVQVIFCKYVAPVLYSCKYNSGISNISIYPLEGKSSDKKYSLGFSVRKYLYLDKNVI